MGDQVDKKSIRHQKKVPWAINLAADEVEYLSTKTVRDLQFFQIELHIA